MEDTQYVFNFFVYLPLLIMLLWCFVERNIMSIQEAYVVMYNILDDYCRESENDSLASLLSDMDPNIFSDKRAADPATYNDWYNCISCYIKNGEITEENIIVALKEFLVYYQQEFGYHLEDVINFISNIDFPIS